MPECNDLRGAKISVLVFGALAFTVMPGLAQKAARQRQLNTDLLAAIRSDDTAAVVTLLQQGADPNQRDMTFSSISRFVPSRPSRSLSPTPLLEAILGPPITLPTGERLAYNPAENLALIAALLDHGANVNARVQFWGQAVPPLAAAVMIAKFPTAEMLAARGADPNIRITQAVPAVGNRSHKVTFPVFMDPLRWVYTSQFQPDRARLIGEMLEHGAQVNCRDSDGTPALVLAVCNLDTVVPSLLAHGADVNARDRDGETALMWAIGDHDTNVEMVRLLLSHGANVNMRDKEGETALTRAMNSWQTPQRKQIVALLKQAGAKELPVNRRKRYRSVHRVG